MSCCNPSTFTENNLVPMVLDTTTGLIRPLAQGEKISSMFLNAEGQSRQGQIQPTIHLQRAYFNLYQRLVALEKKYCECICNGESSMADKFLASVTQNGSVITFTMNDGQQWVINLPAATATPYITDVVRDADNIVVTRSDNESWTVPVCCRNAVLMWGSYTAGDPDFTGVTRTDFSDTPQNQFMHNEESAGSYTFALIDVITDSILAGSTEFTVEVVDNGTGFVPVVHFDPATGLGYVEIPDFGYSDEWDCKIVLKKFGVEVGYLAVTRTDSANNGQVYDAVFPADWTVV